jgi:hypothetical protein
VNEGKKNINKHKNLKKKSQFTTFTAIADLVIKKKTSLLGNRTQVVRTMIIHATS